MDARDNREARRGVPREGSEWPIGPRFPTGAPMFHVAAPGRLPRTVDLEGLPDDLPWALSYRPGVGYMVGIHHARDGMLDGGTHPTPQAAVTEALLFARAHRLFAGADAAMPDPDADGAGQPADYGPRLRLALRLVLAGLLVAALYWQLAA